MTNLSYENIFEEAITAGQAEEMQGFIKVIYFGNHVKIKEAYKNKQLATVIYYLDPAEQENEGIDKVLQLYKESVYFEIRSVRFSGVYKIEDCRFYNKAGNFDDFQITKLYDQSHRLLYEKQSGIENGIWEEEISKYYYPKHSNEYLTCKYNPGTGDLIGISGSNPPFVPENGHFITAEELPAYFPDFIEKKPYYNNDHMIPDSVDQVVTATLTIRLKKIYHLFAALLMASFLIKIVYYFMNDKGNGVPGLDLLFIAIFFFVLLLSLISVYILIGSTKINLPVRIIGALACYLIPFLWVFFGIEGFEGLLDYNFSVLRYLTAASSFAQLELLAAFMAPPIFLIFILYKIYGHGTRL